MIPRLGHRARVATLGAVAAAALALTACTGSGSGAGSTDADTVEGGLSSDVDEAIGTAMELSRSTSAIVGIWTPESGEYVRAYGDESLDSGAHFRAAQSSQPMVCALLLDRVAKGEVELDGEVSEDLTRQVGIDGITYEQLCQQKSGLADFKSSLSGIYMRNPTRPWTDRELLAESLVHSPLSWPGLDVHVSDANALLLGRALHISSNVPLDELLQKNVFDAADMNDTYVPGSEEVELRDEGMTGYAYPRSGGDPVCDAEPIDMAEVSPTMLGTSSSTVTTVTDLKKFYDGYFGGRFGAENTQSLLTEPFPTKNPERDDDGEPVSEEEEPAPTDQQWSFGVENVGPLYGQSGSMPGTLAAAYQDPESGYTVVVVLNNSSAGTGFVKDLAFQLATISSENGAGIEVPWTVDGQAEKLNEAAVCQ